MRRTWAPRLLLLALLSPGGAPLGVAQEAPEGTREQAPPLRVAVSAQDPALAERFAALLEARSGGRVEVADDGARVRLVLGQEGFEKALAEEGELPLLGVGVPRRVADANLDRQRCGCSAIWDGVPLPRQLALLRELLPQAGRVGVLLGPDSAWRAAEIPDDEGLDVVPVDDPDRLGGVLRRHLPRWDALLLPEDDILFNTGVARLVLLTSYRQRVPVVGPDSAFVRAGSVASAYTALPDLAAASLERLDHWRQHGHWPEPGFAGHYSTAVNEHVARAYDLSVRGLRDLEGATP